MTRDQEGFGDEQGFSAEVRMIADRANTPIGSATHLAVKDTSWTAGNLGEMIYVYTLWILQRMGYDSKGSKINRRGWVEQALGIPLGGQGDDWETIPLKQRWVEMGESFL